MKRVGRTGKTLIFSRLEKAVTSAVSLRRERYQDVVWSTSGRHMSAAARSKLGKHKHVNTLLYTCQHLGDLTFEFVHLIHGKLYTALINAP